MSSAPTQPVKTIRDWHWSAAEKAVAHRAFDKVLDRELEAVIAAAKHKAAQVKEASELWDLEYWLSKRRKEIDRKYDFRYSVLPYVFANLIREGSLSEDDLRGLAAEKVESICHIARF